MAGALEGSVEQVEVSAADECVVRAQDVVGWWHAGQGVTDFDNGGDEVKWEYGFPATPGVGDEVTFTGSGARTYSLSVSVVYADDTCADLQAVSASTSIVSTVRLYLRNGPKRRAKYGCIVTEEPANERRVRQGDV